MNKIDKLRNAIELLEKGLSLASGAKITTTDSLRELSIRKTKLFNMRRELDDLEKNNVNSNVNKKPVSVDKSELLRHTITSSSDPKKTYLVRQLPDKTWACSCPSFVFRSNQCKHIESIL